MAAFFITPLSCVTDKVARSDVLGKYSVTISSSAGAPTLSGSITERHVDNNLLRQYFIHLWTHIGVEITQYVCSKSSTPREDTIAGKIQLQQLVMCTAGNMLAVAAICYYVLQETC